MKQIYPDIIPHTDKLKYIYAELDSNGSTASIRIESRVFTPTGKHFDLFTCIEDESHSIKGVEYEDASGLGILVDPDLSLIRLGFDVECVLEHQPSESSSVYRKPTHL